MQHVLVLVIYFLICLGVTYLAPWAIVAARDK
jgi:hypothetical protein